MYVPLIMIKIITIYLTLITFDINIIFFIAYHWYNHLNPLKYIYIFKTNKFHSFLLCLFKTNQFQYFHHHNFHKQLLFPFITFHLITNIHSLIKQCIFFNKYPFNFIFKFINDWFFCSIIIHFNNLYIQSIHIYL